MYIKTAREADIVLIFIAIFLIFIAYLYSKFNGGKTSPIREHHYRHELPVCQMDAVHHPNLPVPYLERLDLTDSIEEFPRIRLLEYQRPERLKHFSVIATQNLNGFEENVNERIENPLVRDVTTNLFPQADPERFSKMQITSIHPRDTWKMILEKYDNPPVEESKHFDRLHAAYVGMANYVISKGLSMKWCSDDELIKNIKLSGGMGLQEAHKAKNMGEYLKGDSWKKDVEKFLECLSKEKPIKGIYNCVGKKDKKEKNTSRMISFLPASARIAEIKVFASLDKILKEFPYSVSGVPLYDFGNRLNKIWATCSDKKAAVADDVAGWDTRVSHAVLCMECDFLLRLTKDRELKSTIKMFYRLMAHPVIVTNRPNISGGIERVILQGKGQVMSGRRITYAMNTITNIALTVSRASYAQKVPEDQVSEWVFDRMREGHSEKYGGLIAGDDSAIIMSAENIKSYAKSHDYVNDLGFKRKNIDEKLPSKIVRRFTDIEFCSHKFTFVKYAKGGKWMPIRDPDVLIAKSIIMRDQCTEEEALKQARARAYTYYLNYHHMLPIRIFACVLMSVTPNTLDISDVDMGWTLNQCRFWLKEKDVLKSIKIGLLKDKPIFMINDHDDIGFSRGLHQSALEMGVNWELPSRIEYVSKLEEVAKSLREKHRVAQFDDWIQYLLPKEHRKTRSDGFVDFIKCDTETFGSLKACLPSILEGIQKAIVVILMKTQSCGSIMIRHILGIMSNYLTARREPSNALKKCPVANQRISNSSRYDQSVAQMEHCNLTNTLDDFQAFGPLPVPRLESLDLTDSLSEFPDSNIHRIPENIKHFYVIATQDLESSHSEKYNDRKIKASLVSDVARAFLSKDDFDKLTKKEATHIHPEDTWKMISNNSESLPKEKSEHFERMYEAYMGMADFVTKDMGLFMDWCPDDKLVKNFYPKEAMGIQEEDKAENMGKYLESGKWKKDVEVFLERLSEGKPIKGIYNCKGVNGERGMISFLPASARLAERKVFASLKRIQEAFAHSVSGFALNDYGDLLGAIWEAPKEGVSENIAGWDARISNAVLSMECKFLLRITKDQKLKRAIEMFYRLMAHPVIATLRPNSSGGVERVLLQGRGLVISGRRMTNEMNTITNIALTLSRASLARRIEVHEVSEWVLNNVRQRQFICSDFLICGSDSLFIASRSDCKSYAESHHYLDDLGFKRNNADGKQPSNSSKRLADIEFCSHRFTPVEYGIFNDRRWMPIRDPDILIAESVAMLEQCTDREDELKLTRARACALYVNYHHILKMRIFACALMSVTPNTMDLSAIDMGWLPNRSGIIDPNVLHYPRLFDRGCEDDCYEDDCYDHDCYEISDHDDLGNSKLFHQYTFGMGAGWKVGLSKLEELTRSIRERDGVTQFDDWIQYLLPKKERKNLTIEDGGIVYPTTATGFHTDKYPISTNLK